MKRVLLARSGNLATRERVYLIPDGFEVDEVDHYEVHRSRVLFDDVVLVTHHRYRSPWFLSIFGVMTALCALMAWAIGSSQAMAGWIIAGTTVLPLLLAIILHIVFGTDEINVYGRRSRARIRFGFRKGRARKIMDDIVTTVRERQGGAAVSAQ